MGSASDYEACDNFIKEFDEELKTNAPKVDGVYVGVDDLNISVHYCVNIIGKDLEEHVLMFPEAIYTPGFEDNIENVAEMFEMDEDEVESRFEKADC